MARRPPPLLHDVYDLALDCYRLVPGFPKGQRFVLGQRIEQATLALLFGVDAAGDPAERIPALKDAARGLDQLRLLLRLARDLCFLPHDRHESLCLRLDEVGRKLGGWQRWARS